jgi:hypothetical protein
MSSFGEPAPSWVAVDPVRVSAPSAALAAWLEGVRARPAVRGELRLVETAGLSAALRAELEACAALHPVLQQAGARLIVLPEVRVELRDAGEAQALRAGVERGTPAAAVEEPAGAAVPTLVLRPRSGRGADALELAEALRGRAGVAAVAPRLLRVVPR